MKTLYLIAIMTILGISPIFIYAEEGYIGENPGLNFYSRIDDGNYQITNKIVQVRLAETPELDQFGKDCVGGVKWLKSGRTEDVVDIVDGKYSKLFLLLEKNNITANTDTFQALTLCLIEKYRNLREQVAREQKTIENISSLGLYMDGDISNSDYDIITDITKINTLIFSQDIKYTGATNKSASAFRDFLAGKVSAPLFENTQTPTNTGSVQGGSSATGGVKGSENTINTSGNPSSASLIGGVCSSTSVTSILGIEDEGFLRELELTLRGGVTGENIGLGYTPDIGRRDRSGSGNSNNLNPNNPKSSSSDFFDKMPCTTIFCIKVSMVSGSQNLIGGGKNISIEGILDKHKKILEPISESALRDEKMTNNFASLPFANLKLVKTLAGLQVYLANSPQRSRNDKRDETDQRKEEKLEEARRCAFASVGLDSDKKRANGLIGGGYVLKGGSTTENAINTYLPLGSQATDLSRYSGCIEAGLSEGRKVYYDSFSTDLTEIQSFTAAMLAEIEDILTLGTKLDNKPVK